MADDEKWGLSREEIEKRLRELNQKKKAQGPTRGGRTSGQDVKLLCIRDYLYAHATREHPALQSKMNSAKPPAKVFSLGKHILIFVNKNTPKNAKIGSTSSGIFQK